jgi:hypothetical protein
MWPHFGQNAEAYGSICYYASGKGLEGLKGELAGSPAHLDGGQQPLATKVREDCSPRPLRVAPPDNVDRHRNPNPRLKPNPPTWGPAHVRSRNGHDENANAGRGC